MRIKSKQKGIGLVEVIFSLGIAVIILTSLVSLAVFTLRSSVQNKLLLKGSSLATQQLELVRAYRDSNTWTTFITVVKSCKATSVCHANVDTLAVESGSLIIGTGAEAVTLSFSASDAGGGDVEDTDSYVRISVMATWKIGSENKYVHNYTELSNWQE